jgi:NTE family protein
MFGQNKIGLVLGGGGVRGFFHIGVIKGLQEKGIKISEISGTSIGAIIGLMYAANPNNDFEKITKDLDFLKLMKAMVWGMNKTPSEVIEKFLADYIKVENFGELKIPMRFNATDINKKQEVIFERGKIFPAIIASISVPGVFPPLEYQGNFLVDGGVINNIPITLIKKSDRIIVSDITGPIKTIDKKSFGTDVLYSSIAIMQQNISLEKAKNIKNKKIIYLNLEDDKTFILDFRKKNYQFLIDLGYKSIMTRGEKI